MKSEANDYVDHLCDAIECLVLEIKFLNPGASMNDVFDLIKYAKEARRKETYRGQLHGTPR